MKVLLFIIAIFFLLSGVAFYKDEGGLIFDPPKYPTLDLFTGVILSVIFFVWAILI